MTAIPAAFQHSQPLSRWTTFGIGGPARYFVEVCDVDAMQQALSFCTTHSLPFFILGKGSNLLVDDRGFSGVVIANRIEFIEKLADNVFYVGAGYSFSLLGSQTARQGLSGLEFASGIPGSVGGAVYMNAGANGRETCDSLLSVDFVDAAGALHRIPREELIYRYRYSSFQELQGAIVSATFGLQPLDSARKRQLDIIQYRKTTQPYKDKSAGCIFRNPPVGHAGALIEQSGLKGVQIGGAQVSAVHANFIVNVGEASAADVLALIERVKGDVRAAMGVALESEVRYLAYE